MPIELNHTIVAARDAETSARWFAELFGADEPEPFGHFWQVTTDNGVGLDFASAGPDADIGGIHYAFLVGEDDFTAIYGRIVERGMEHWADPRPVPSRGDQPPRRWPRRLLPEQRRPLPRDHHPSLRQRRLRQGSGRSASHAGDARTTVLEVAHVAAGPGRLDVERDRQVVPAAAAGERVDPVDGEAARADAVGAGTVPQVVLGRHRERHGPVAAR